MLPPEGELDPEERDRVLDRVARAVVRHGMAVPAILALELHRPLTFLGSQALAFLTPVLAPAVGLGNMHLLYRLLEDRENLDRLVDRIEDLVAESRGATPGEPGSPAPDATEPDREPLAADAEPRPH